MAQQRKRKKTARLDSSRKSPAPTWMVVSKWCAIVGIAGAAAGSVLIASMFWYYGADDKLPTIAKLSDYRPKQVVRVVSNEGELVGEIFSKRRTYVPLDELPKELIHAFVSAEDAKFFEHEGLDYVGMVRAVFKNIKAGRKKQGASTITQQVVKNLLLSSQRSFRRKFQEIILARRIESTLSKEDILALYANEIYFGHGRYGVEEAARYYFGKSARTLNVGECAVLAGLPKGPENYSPRKEKNRERAKLRQTYVLDQMFQNGYLSEEVAQKWIDRPIEIVADANPMVGRAPEWVELVRKDLRKKFSEEELDQLSVEVKTTLDLRAQRVAEDALRAGLHAYDKRKGFGRAIKHYKEDKAKLELAKLERKLPKKGPSKGGRYRAIVTSVGDAYVDVNLGGYPARVALATTYDKRFNPDAKKASERFSAGDLVRIENTPDPGLEADESMTYVRFASGPEGAVVVIDPKSRKVLAAVGGYDVQPGGFNRTQQAKRQAGSTFKPIVYAAAIESGDFSPASIVNDAPEVYDLWKPENYKKGHFEGPVRLRHALAKSINTVAIRVAYDLTYGRVQEFARKIGVHSKLPDGLSLALGSAELSPLELTNAFATFAAGGRYRPPQLIESIGSQAVQAPEATNVLGEDVAYLAIDMMRSVITEGTGGKAKSLGMDLAGKTGTSSDERDAWFVGMSADLVIGVWVGFDDFSRSLGRKEGGSLTALPIFIDIMKKLGKRSSRFRMPPGVLQLRVDRKTGLLAQPGVVEDSYLEVFIEGTQPTEYAAAPDQVDVGDFLNQQYDSSDPLPPEEPAP